MANYAPQAKSLLYTLSDFWTLYFREQDVLTGLYRGAEIEVGQAYLDMMALLLNNSVQDTTLFNTAYFKLLRLREDTISFSSDGRYNTALDTDVAGVQYLHDRVFEPTHALERGLDFEFDEASRSISLPYDPFAAYVGIEIGTSNSAFFVETVQPGIPKKPISVVLVDAAVVSPTLVRAETFSAITVTITYAGSANGSVHSAATLVALINTAPSMEGFLSARLTGLATGTATPPAGAYLLSRQSLAPLKSFATRTFDVAFGTRFLDSAVASWEDTDVQKGDVVRILRGPFYGQSQEFPVALVRPDALYFYPQAAPVNVTGGLEYVILRTPEDDVSLNEPVPAQGSVAAFIPGGTVNASTSTYFSAGAGFTHWNIGQQAELSGLLNIGAWTILDVPDSDTLVLGGIPLLDEVNVEGRIRTVITDYDVDGEFYPGGDNEILFFSPSFTRPADTTACVVLGVIDGVVRKFEVLPQDPGPNLAILRNDGLTSNYVGVEWAVATSNGAAFSPIGSLANGALPVPGTLTIDARRFFDGGSVVEGRDYHVDYDRGVITPMTIWQPLSTFTLAYRYREILASTLTPPLKAAVDGTLVSETELSSFTIGFGPEDVGTTLQIAGSAAGNDGLYVIEQVYNAVTVRLSGRALALPDANSGSLDLLVFRRARAVTEDVIEPVTELAAWAPNAKIDKFHLYFTYGYLINRIRTSSEGYRALIRGIFQLFMLGPTLERFESAINAVAGLETVRDDGEVFLSYNPQSGVGGATGSFDGNTFLFTDPAANFAPADVFNRLYVTSGFNRNRLFTIVEVLDTTTIRVAESPVTDSSVTWELTATGEHSVTTSRATYTYPRTVPLKEKFLTPANSGVLTLSAFEVITAVFTVTDYVETPRWWEFARIPQELWPAASSQRRQSTAALFENVIGASDGACIGDPGFYIGAGDDGTVLPQTVLLSGVTGAFVPDPHYPVSTSEVFFTAPELLGENIVGNILRITFPAPYNTVYEFRIAEAFGSAAKLVSFAPISGAPIAGLTWEIVTGTVPMRHNAAYMVLDLYLKTHVFSVRFDTFLFDTLATDVITDLQELVFVAKPTYTYLLLTPAALFDEVFRLQEELEQSSRYQLGGSGGNILAANLNPLRIGDGWRIGSWYRYVDFSGSFATPAASVPLPLDTPRPGFDRLVHQFYVDPATFTADSVPIPFDAHVRTQVVSANTGSIAVFPTYVEFAADAPVFSPNMLMTELEISGSGGGLNDGRFRIGAVIDASTVHFVNASAVFEVGVTFVVNATGGDAGRVTRTSEGATYFDQFDFSGGIFSDPQHVGTRLRRPFVTTNLEQSYDILEVVNGQRVRVGEKVVVYEGLTATLSSGKTLSFTPGDFVVLDEQCYEQRRIADPATARTQVFYVVFLDGPNVNLVRSFRSALSPTSVQLDTADLPNSTGLVRIYYEMHVLGPLDSGGAWEHLETPVYVDNVFSPGPVWIGVITQDAGTADFTAFGVEVPIDPSTEVFSETAGDTYYTIGGPSPATRRFHNRTSRDMDMFEVPVAIARTPTVVFSIVDPAGDGIDDPAGDDLVST